jgi:steroid delta-isomerase-like uncharacterized protein
MPKSMIFYNLPQPTTGNFEKKPMKPVLVMLLLLQMDTYSQSTNNHMSVSEQNKQIVQKVHEQALNKRNFDLLNNLVADEFTGIAGKKGPEAFKEPVQNIIKALPDAQWTIEELIAEGNKVMVKWQIEGTSQGPFNGFAATGKKVINEGMGIYTFRDGKITAVHVLTDRVAFLQQLNVLPNDLSVLAAKKGQVIFIDKFSLPAAGKKEFYERMHMNRSFIKKLPGFITDEAYESTDDQGNLNCITIAQWQSMEAITQAREAVQAEYKRIGFDREELYKRLQITVNRAIYTPIKD